LPRLPDRYEKVLTGHWNRWLAKRCGDSAAVNRRWSGVNEPPGEELLTNGTFAKGSENWTGESPDVMSMARTDGKPALHIRCLKPGKLAWTMQMHQIGLELKDGKPYTFHFQMRSAKPAKVQTVARLDHAHPESGRFEVVGLNRPFQVGPEWQDYSFTFLARKPRGKGNRIGFTFPNQKGEFWLANTSLKPGGRIGGIAPGESLEAGTIRRPLGIAESTAAQWRDWIACVCEIESTYFAEMRRFLKEDLGVKCPVIGSQVSYGGIYGALREGTMDYGDMHAYWQHPRFLGRAWDMRNWRVANTPMVDAPERSTLARLARHRLAGKPFVVSEYNHPAPSQYASECWPMAAAIGGVQDWDGIIVHNYLNYGPGEWTAGRKVGLFDTATNPQKTPFVFAAAVLFRTGALAPAPAHCYRSYTQSFISEGLALGQLGIVDGWPQTGEDGLLMLNRKLSIRVAALGDEAPGGMASRPTPPAPQVRWQHGKNREPRLTVDIPSVKAVTGQIAGKTVDLGGAKISIRASRTGYATVTLVALDGKPVSVSSRLLLSVGGSMANTGWKWNEEKTMLTSWGKSPTLTEVIPGQLTLKRKGDQKLRAFALDGAGRRLSELPMESGEGNHWTLPFGDAGTMWYEIISR
ncbi:MAG: hypothetical protein HN849_35340, partial [Victivallales bacterium]|nr:hypothetical protein [Victivallales bacterium]